MSRTNLESAIDELTAAQAAAVAWGDGPLFVLAGPGSGKTRVLTTRIGRLLSDSPDRSFRVLALTFTNKAADEMAARVATLTPEQDRRALVGTFHSFCMQMLQQHGSHIGINPDFVIYSLDSDRQDLLKEAMRSVGVSSDVSKFLVAIDKLKARLIAPEGCARRFRDPASGRQVEKLYSAYEELLKRTNGLDFGSLIARSYQLISTSPGIAIRYRKTYAYWMFDEFQDTTDGQYRFIRALAGDDFHNVLAVADDDQIIYQWNGASYQQIQRFRADYSPSEMQLPTNYRCPPNIVAAANRLVVHNVQRTTMKLPLESGKATLRYPDADHISVLRFSDEEVEAREVSAGIASLSLPSRGQTAVLARTRAMLDKVSSALNSAGVEAVIAQRRDDFRSPQFLWLAAVLRLTSRPLDKRALEVLTGAFNRWFDLGVRVDEIIAAAELSSCSYLDEWATAARSYQRPGASELIELAASAGKEPGRYRDFIENVLKDASFTTDLTSDVSEDSAAWADLSRAIGKSVGRAGSLEQFLQELAIRSKEPPIGSTTVTLMTIHGAKGKEFDHVYVVGVAEEILPSFHSLKAGEASAEMEEERRNCFVAITRAREWLCLSYADRYKGWPKKASRFLTEMGLTLPERPTA